MTHPFEASGCGRAPFKFVSASEGDEVCRHCGTRLKVLCLIRDADGKTFVVGTSCVERTEDGDLIADFNMSHDLRRIAQAKAAWKEQRDRGELRAMLEAHGDALSRIPYGNGSLLKWADWKLKNGPKGEIPTLNRHLDRALVHAGAVRKGT